MVSPSSTSATTQTRETLKSPWQPLQQKEKRFCEVKAVDKLRWERRKETLVQHKNVTFSFCFQNSDILKPFRIY